MMTRSLGWIGLAVILSACSTDDAQSGSAVGQATGVSQVTLEPITQEELIEEIKLLTSVPDLAGECLELGGKGSPELHAYVEVAMRAAAMSHAELLETYESMIPLSKSSANDDITKLHLINRMIYDVPESFPHSGLYDPDIRYWRYTPVTDEAIDYLFPLEYGEQSRLCMNPEPLQSPYGSFAIVVESHLELGYFEENFPRRDLSVYLEKGD